MEYLADQGKLFDREMERVLPRDREPWEVYGLIWDFLDRGGKRFRPVMCKLACEAVGGDGAKSVPAGAAIEFFHNFSLIHDDIEDDSEMRRGKPTLHRKYGVPLAINAGDGLFMVVWEEALRLDYPPEKIIAAQKMLNRAFRHVLEGQAVELNWYREKRFDISERDFFRMVEGKTGSLISAACEVGAFLGGGTEEQIKALREFGMAVGVAFQIQDDVLNLTGQEEKYGKEIGGDITEGKRSLITIHALSVASPADRKRLVDILSSNTRDPAEISEAIEICRKYGSIDYASAKARKMVEDAKKEIMILPNNAATKRLLQLADFFVYREL